MDGAGSDRQIRSAIDFAGYAELKALAERDERAALRETAQQFESMFMQMMMKTMREATMRSELFDTPAMQNYEAMHDRELAVHLSRHGGFGLSEMLVTQLARAEQPSVAQEALRLRPDAADAQRPLALREGQRAYSMDVESRDLTLRPLGSSGSSLPLRPEVGASSSDDRP